MPAAAASLNAGAMSPTLPAWTGDIRLRAAIGNIVVAIVVLALKWLAWRRTGSVALYSDALKSFVNVATALLALLAVTYAGRPADREHPFGHHKAEYMSAVVSGAMILLAAGLILEAAWGAWRAPKAIGGLTEGVVWSGLATLINAAWGGFLVLRSAAWRSPALAADGRHILTDVWTSVAVLAGFVATWVTGWHTLDVVTAVVVALAILWSGWKVTRQSFSGLMDEAVTADILGEIRKVIATEATGALEAHDLRTRHAGAATFIEFHLVVPGDMSVRSAHEICDRIEAALRAHIEGARVLIHVEPEEKAKHSGVLVI